MFVTRKPEVSSMVITDPRHVLGLTDERLAEELIYPDYKSFKKTDLV